jgi:hypothetical protein
MLKLFSHDLCGHQSGGGLSMSISLKDIPKSTQLNHTNVNYYDKMLVGEEEEPAL